ncbi:MAG: thioester reductase domain-containing protein [Eubacteriales bacterium]|nr:thioester reductase domain-containing protein [Eubacteriales bacterium]
MDGILELFHRRASETPKRVLYNFLDCETAPFGENRVTVREAWKRSEAIAAELKAKGAKKGDRAIILSMQDAGTVYAVWGCMMIGVVFTLIPPPLDEGKLNRFASVLKSCGPKFLISNEGLEKTSETNASGALMRQAFFQVVALKRIYTDKVKPYHGPELLCTHEGDDLLYLQYTSGSTSAPKGVMVTYQNLMSCIDLCLEIFDFQKKKQVLASWVPFYHNIGLVVSIFMQCIANDGYTCFIPTLQFLQNPSIWLETMSQYHATITAAPNSAYELCTRLFTEEEACQYDLSSMTHFINGSEFVDAYTIDKFCRLFHVSPDAFAPGYGLSECVCVATLSSRDFRQVKIDLDAYYNRRLEPTEQGEKTIVSVGRPAIDLKVVAIREDGTPCEPGEIGEICLRGSNVCGGYWKNPEESRSFETKIPGYKGKFYRTGDMGAMHDGQLYLTGRIKEMLVIGGKNIFPSDITLALQKEGVALAMNGLALFSIQQSGNERAVLCAESEPDADFHGLAAQVNKIVSHVFGFSFMDIVFVKKNTLPRTDNQKIKTLAAKSAYEREKLEVLFSTLKHGAAAAEAKMEPAAHRKKAVLPENAKPEDVQPLIQAIFSELLPGMEFGPDDSFMELGGDSLRLMELVCELEKDLDIAMDLREVAAAPTVGGISNYISALLSGDVKSREVDLRAECKLDADIRPEAAYACRPEECRNIFVTGTTGFLGAYLVRSLIQQRHKKGVRVYCHGRGASQKELMERIVSNMRRFHCWKEEYRKFIVPVPGDLNLPNLGMEAKVYERLSKKIDLVIHNGAILNFVFPYTQMKRTNVEGTAEALRFAAKGRAKYFHYISSYSVYDNPSHFGRHVMENDPLESPEGYFLGYSETKWVAEKLVGIAKERGLRTAIYRPGDITGTRKDGIWKLEDLISRSIVGCIQLGYVPEIDVHLHLTPVDYVADAVVWIAFQSGSVGQAFNLLNKKLMPLEQFYLQERKLGYPVGHLPFDEWCRKLETCTNEENVLRILSCLFTDQRKEGENLIERFGGRQAEFDMGNTERLLEGSGIRCPAMDAGLMKRYLKYFHECGYIAKPVGGVGGTLLSVLRERRER